MRTACAANSLCTMATTVSTPRSTAPAAWARPSTPAPVCRPPTGVPAPAANISPSAIATPDYNPFSEYDQFTARGDKQNILVLGGGVDYSESGANKIIYHTLDAQYNTTNGWAFYAAYLGAYRNLYTNRGVKPGSYYDSGVLLQASYLLTPKIEPFIRYDYTHLDGDAQPGIIQDNIDEITLGANYYLFGQQAKFTVDGTWLPNGSPTDVNYLDILQDNSHNEFVVRMQFQLAL